MNEIETENRGIAALLHGYYRNRNKDWIKDKMTKRQKLRQTIDRANMSMPVAMSIAMTLTIHFPFHFGLSWWCNFLEERDLRFTREVHRIVGRRVGGRRAQFGRCRSWIYKKKMDRKEFWKKVLWRNLHVFFNFGCTIELFLLSRDFFR